MRTFDFLFLVFLNVLLLRLACPNSMYGFSSVGIPTLGVNNLCLGRYDKKRGSALKFLLGFSAPDFTIFEFWKLKLHP